MEYYHFVKIFWTCYNQSIYFYISIYIFISILRTEPNVPNHRKRYILTSYGRVIFNHCIYDNPVINVTKFSN